MSEQQIPTDTKHIRSEIDNHVCWITLCRSEKMNSICKPLAEKLLDVLREAERNPEVRVVVLQAEGRAFCAGQDLKEALTFPSAKQIVEDVYNPLVREILYSMKPVIAVVQGLAVGAGANLALLCDFVIASENAVFSQAFSKIGLVPDTGGSFLLPRMVGLNKSKELCMLADDISAQKAHDLGLIYQVVKSEQLGDAANVLAQKLANGPTLAYGLTKRMLVESYSSSLDRQLEIESEFQDKASKSQDFKEGVSAFLEKRAPRFSGE